MIEYNSALNDISTLVYICNAVNAQYVIIEGDFKGMEHVPNIFMSFDKYLFLEVINILI